MNNLNSLFSFFNTRDIMFYSTARHAFKEALDLLKLNNSDVILIPDFICRDLLSSISEAGLNFQFYSVNEYLKPISLPENSNIKVVLAVNYFGFPQSLDIFRDYCKKNKCILIEDNAHGFLSSDDNGEELGKRAPLGFTSFRKIIPVYNGAALFINSDNFISSDLLSLNPTTEILPFRFVIKDIARKIQTSTNFPLKNYFEDFSRFLRKIVTGSEIPSPRINAEIEIGFKKEIHQTSVNKLITVIATEEVKRRRKLFQKFYADLENLEIIPIYKQLPDNVSPYGYPFIAKKEVARDVSRIARKSGFTCVKWPDLPLIIDNNCPNYYKKIYFVDFLE